MNFFASFLGRLNLDALPDEPVTIGGAVMMSLTGLAVFGLLTYKKRWTWLWRNWLTTLDPKKIGLMYIIVAMLMLLRGGADAMMIRLQQATASGSDGVFTTDLF